MKRIRRCNRSGNQQRKTWYKESGGSEYRKQSGDYPGGNKDRQYQRSHLSLSGSFFFFFFFLARGLDEKKSIVLIPLPSLIIIKKIVRSFVR